MSINGTNQEIGKANEAKIRTPIGEVRICHSDLDSRLIDSCGMNVQFRENPSDRWRTIADAWFLLGCVTIQALEAIGNKEPGMECTWEWNKIPAGMKAEMAGKNDADAAESSAIIKIPDGMGYRMAAAETAMGLNPSAALYLFDSTSGEEVWLLTVGYRDAGDGTGCIEVVVNGLGDEDACFQPVYGTAKKYSPAETEDSIRRRNYTAASNLGVERIFSRAKTVSGGMLVYGFPMAFCGRFYIVRGAAADTDGNFAKLDAVECDPNSLQMRACACGWSLWEGDILNTQNLVHGIRYGEPFKIKVVWDPSDGCWCAEPYPTDSQTWPWRHMRMVRLETYMANYGEEAVCCGNAAD